MLLPCVEHHTACMGAQWPLNTRIATIDSTPIQQHAPSPGLTWLTSALALCVAMRRRACGSISRCVYLCCVLAYVPVERDRPGQQQHPKSRGRRLPSVLVCVCVCARPWLRCRAPHRRPFPPICYAAPCALSSARTLVEGSTMNDLGWCSHPVLLNPAPSDACCTCCA